jgi:hypothetical protein
MYLKMKLRIMGQAKDVTKMSIKKKRNARALAFTSPSLSKGLFIMVDGFFNLAAKSKLLFEGVASVLKIWFRGERFPD